VVQAFSSGEEQGVMIIRSVGQALSWEYWRRGMLWFVPACVGLTVACLLLVAMGEAGGPRFRWADVGVHLRGGLVPFVIWIPVILSFASWTAIRRHYTLPVSTARLVVWSLANGGAAVAAAYLATAWVLNGVLHADWPLVLPALCSLAVYVGFQAMLWWIGPSRGLAFLVAMILIALLMAVSRLSAIQSSVFVPAEFPRAWTDLTIGQIGLWLGVLIVSYVLAINGVARDRRGGAWSLAWLADARASVLQGVSPGRYRTSAGRSFRSASAAQFWLEWRTKGRLVPLTVGGPMLALWISFWILALEPYGVGSAIDLSMVTLVILSPFIGVFFGCSSRNFDLPSFAATRPLSDRELASAVLRNAAASLLSTALLWLVGTGLMLMLPVWRPERWRAICQAWEGGWLQFHWQYGVYAVMLLLISWTCVGLGAALGLARSWFVGCAGVGAGAAFLSFLWAIGRGPPPLAEFLVVLVAWVCWGGTVAAFLVAYRWRLVSKRAVVGCLLGYLVVLGYFYVVLGYFYPAAGVFAHGAMSLAGALFSVLPLAPFAAAPLALSWNRHR
jgi:hypothetical protein